MQLKMLLAGGHTLSKYELYRSEHPNMLDVILVAAAVAFFALSVGYVVACDRL
jgi:hypothetical protein